MDENLDEALPFIFASETIYVAMPHKFNPPLPGGAMETEQPSENEQMVSLNIPIQPNFAYLGQNKQHILILVAGQNPEILAEEEKAFVEKILQAVKLSLADVSIVCIEAYPLTTPEALFDYFTPKTVLLFGQDLQQNIKQANIPPYQLTNTAQVRLLVTDTLSAIAADVSLKKKLWEQLKALFL